MPNRKTGSIAIVVLAGILLLTACHREENIVRIHTRMGDMRARLFDSTPGHRDNFVRLIRTGFYDSLLFHRVQRDFMIQGGDPDSKRAPAGALLGGGGPGYELPAEIGAPHLRGALAAARLPDAANPARRSNGSQFFIVQGRAQTDASLDQLEQRTHTPIRPEWRAMYKQTGGAPQLDGQYTVFGMLVDGFEVLDRIAALPRDANDRPLEDIRMQISVER